MLPAGFHRIRYYGWLGNRHRTDKLTQCRQLLGPSTPEPPVATAPADYRDRYQALTGRSLRDCPRCAHDHMRAVESLALVDKNRPIADSS